MYQKRLLFYISPDQDFFLTQVFPIFLIGPAVTFLFLDHIAIHFTVTLFADESVEVEPCPPSPLTGLHVTANALASYFTVPLRVMGSNVPDDSLRVS